jgi:Predicted epimerase, PhzC/PhzF homolog
MVVLESQQQVEALTPDIAAMLPLDKMVCITAPGEQYDFVSRFFCPGEGVPEDPVTGSAHSMHQTFSARRNLSRRFLRMRVSRKASLAGLMRQTRVSVRRLTIAVLLRLP